MLGVVLVGLFVYDALTKEGESRQGNRATKQWVDKDPDVIRKEAEDYNK